MKLQIYSYKRERIEQFFEQLKKVRIYCLEGINNIKTVQDRNFNITDYLIKINVNEKQLNEIVLYAKSYFFNAIEYYSFYHILRI